jgi:hypothetical protein
MKLRFAVNQAEAFRRGVDTPHSTVVIDVDPAKLDQDQRNLIADRLLGIDVHHLRLRVEEGEYSVERDPDYVIEAILPTFDSLLEAVRVDHKVLEADLAKAKQSAKHV